jgi:hypothetical protein
LNNRSTIIVATLVAAILLLTSIGEAARRYPRPKRERTAPTSPTINTGKKVIEYGWDAPYPSYVAQHQEAVESQPFDGVMLRVQPPEKQSVFTRERWGGAALDREFSILRSIQWKKFTDNFLVAYSASNMDWFSDSDWDAVSYNIGLLAREARLSRCKGIVFDPEAYGPNPWHYPAQPHAGSKSFAEYQAIVRKRGAQFMRAIENNFPGAEVHTFFLTSIYHKIGVNPADPTQQARLASNDYGAAWHMGLYASFIYGMLDAARTGTVIHDGNEISYWYTTPEEFTTARSNIRGAFANMVPTELRMKYLSTVRCSQAIYMDYIFNLRNTGVWSPGAHLTVEEQNQWLEHNMYYALQTADKYVWVYGEYMEWWSGAIPQGAVQAIQRACQKYESGQPLGYSLKPIMDKAWSYYPN